MVNKEKYRKFCTEEENIPIFSQDWWLDAVCGEQNWDVAIVEKGGEIWATMPYYIKKKYGFTLLTMPHLTQTLGPYIKYPHGQKYYKKLSWEKEIMNELIDQLPKFDYFYQQWHYSVTNWLPFYWRGFKQTTRYTYVIDTKNIPLDLLENEYEVDIRRRRRRKAQKAGIIIYEKDDINELYKLSKMTFERKRFHISYDLDFLNNLYSACRITKSCKIYFAKLQQDLDLAAMFLIYDKNSIYYLIGGIDPNKKDLGGMDVLLHEGMKYAYNSNKIFDFEGSMIESVEKYFRSFGAIQKPYFAVSKINSKILKTYFCLKEVLQCD